jgi:hypothetical protein
MAAPADPSPAAAATGAAPSAYSPVAGIPDVAAGLSDDPVFFFESPPDPVPPTSAKPLTIVVPSTALVPPGSSASPPQAPAPDTIDPASLGSSLPGLPLPTEDPSSLVLPSDPPDTTGPGDAGDPADATDPEDTQQLLDQDVGLPVDANVGLEPQAALPLTSDEDASAGDILSGSLIR